MNYGDVALGVECALPADFAVRTRERGLGKSLLWLVLVLAAAATL
ncbi:MAG TPA: hypothetical protein VI730_05070 [Burkholderiales bacterium]|jgi:hypothetical protein|nr:hypothetical protein [Burkholderiales bacterium]